MAVTVDNLEIEIEASSSQAAEQIERLASAFENLKTRVKGGAGLTTVTKQLQTLANVTKQIDSSGIGKIREIIYGVRELETISNVRISASIASQLMALGQSIKSIQWTDGDKIEALANGLRPLTELGKSNLTSFINQLGKLSDVIEKLDDADLDKFATQMQRVTAAIGPLASEMNKVSAGFASFPTRVKQVISSNNALAASNTKVGKTFNFIRFGAVIAAARSIGTALGKAITASNAYVESLNLFTVAMGDYAESAKNYADQVEAVMGIDPAEWLRAQGVFMTLATGFGVAADRAALMSKNLTQLGYDLSSFFNINVDEAMQKLQSGISGELEPLRRLGYDLSQAQLEATALSLGIDKSVASMTQAEKAQLRYYAILTQVTTAQGDMARTLEAPANQLRILKASVEQAARAIGNVFIPILNAVLPYVIAFVQVVEFAANALAELLGFELPSIDYSGIGSVTSGVGDLEDALEDASGAAKELKGQLAGFDEITIIGQQNAGGGGGGGGSSLGDGFDFELPEYDFLGDAVSGKVDEAFKQITKALKELEAIIKPVAAALAGMWAASKLIDFIRRINELKNALGQGGLSGALGTALTALKGFLGGFAVGALTTYVATLLDAKDGTLDWSIALTGATVALGGIIAAIGLARGSIGAFFTGIGLMVGALYGVKLAQDEILRQKVGEWFYAYTDGGKAITELASEYARFADTVITKKQPIIDAFNAYSEGKASVQELSIEIDALLNGMLNGVVDVETELPRIKTAFETLLTDTKGILQELRDTILLSLSGATGDAFTAMGGDLNAIYALLGETFGAADETLVKSQERLDELFGKLASGGGSADAIIQEMIQLNSTIAALTEEANPALIAFDEAKRTAFSGVDFENADAVSEALEVFKTKTTEATTAIEEAANAEIKVITDLQNLAKNLGIEISPETQTVLNQYLEQIRATRDADVAAVNAEFESVAMQISQSLVSASRGIIEAAQADWDAKSGLDQWWTGMFQGGGEAGYVENAIKQYKSNYVDPVTEGLVEANGSIGAAVKERTDNAFEILDDALFGEETQIGAHFNTTFKTYIGTVDDALKEAERSVLTSAKNVGAAGTEGIAQGAVTAAALAKLRDAFSGSSGVAEKVIEYAESAFEINSPAKIMIPTGEFITAGIAEGLIDRESEGYITDAMEELSEYMQTEFSMATIGVFEDEVYDLVSEIANGISYNSYLASSAMQDMLNEMLRSVESFSSRVASVMNETVQNMADSMASVDISSSGNVSFDRVSGASVSYFASGGFPEQGQMFIAREAGPELVGQIGGRTAVANNDQIVDGITAGVQSANAEQNALLRRQNDLLMALLEKESTVTLGKPNAEFGRFASRSIGKYSAVRGAT